MKPVLILMSGTPLAGKSTLAHKIKDHFGSDCKIVSTDEIRKSLTENYADYSREYDVWTVAVKNVLKHLNKGRVVVMDATLRQKDVRMEHLKYYKDYDIYYIAFERLPYEVIEERNIDRYWKTLDSENLKRLYDGYEFPEPDELLLYKKAIIINPENQDLNVNNLLYYIDQERRKNE